MVFQTVVLIRQLDLSFRTKNKGLNACFVQRAVIFQIIPRTVKFKTLNITCLSVAVVIYLVSFEPDLSLLSRNPNVTLMWEDETCEQREEQLKNIRGGRMVNLYFYNNIPAFSADNDKNKNLTAKNASYERQTYQLTCLVHSHAQILSLYLFHSLWNKACG